MAARRRRDLDIGYGIPVWFKQWLVLVEKGAGAALAKRKARGGTLHRKGRSERGESLYWRKRGFPGGTYQFKKFCGKRRESQIL